MTCFQIVLLVIFFGIAATLTAMLAMAMDELCGKRSRYLGTAKKVLRIDKTNEAERSNNNG